MNFYKVALLVLVAGCCAVPAGAQQAKKSLNKKVEAAVERAQAHKSASTALPELTTAELIQAEEELQHIRSVQDSNATFKKYPYLLDPAYRRKQQPDQTPNQAQPVSTSEEDNCAALDTRELIQAEEELQHIREVQDSNATFEKYPYLLDPVYRRHKNSTCPCAKQQASASTAGNTPAAQEDTELSLRELIEAETELASIRNTWDMRATFEKYPYLLDPVYRRASDDSKRSIRRPYTQPSWARSVGL